MAKEMVDEGGFWEGGFSGFLLILKL